jgi:hypothetical protein
VDRVHGRWTPRGPPWTGSGTDWWKLGRGGVLAGVWPLATPKHVSTPARVQQREGSVGSPSRASPGLKRQCGDRVTAEKLWRRGNSMVAVLELGGRGKMRGGGVANGSMGLLLL